MPGVLALDAEGNARALDLLEQAMDEDPTHALAVGADGLGACCSASSIISRPSRQRRARAASS